MGPKLACFFGLTHVVLPGSHMRQTDSGTAATLLLLEVVLHTAAALVGSTVTHTLDSSLNSGLNCHLCIGKEQEPAMINISQMLHEQDFYQERPLSLLISIKPESSAC